MPKSLQRLRNFTLFKALYRHIQIYKLGRYTEKHLTPKILPGAELNNWIPTSELSMDGLDLHVDNQLHLLKKWGKEYRSFFYEIRADPSINKGTGGKDYLENEYYITPDAEIYLSMIIDYKPKKILEVGSGFSTLIARRAVELGNLETEIEIIDPSPRTSVEKSAHKIRYDPIENIPLNEIDLCSNMFLFIDSSHICRPGGDLPYLYCQLIPSLPGGTIVHVHDAFLPYDYPTAEQKRLYSENYLLHTLLCHSSKFKILFSSHYMARTFPDEMQKAISPFIAINPRFFGGSIWFSTLS